MAEPRATRAARGTRLAIVSGSAAAPLADAVARAIGTALVGREIARFPDGECRIRILDSLRGEDAYILQPTSPPVDENLMELLLLGDACRRAGAARLTAVIPYLGYARQDRRATGREPVGARLVADLLETGGFGRVVAIDLHSAALEGFFGRPLEHLTAVPLLAERT
jgi:ribose-phosphate pyrophosphokinase